MDDTVERAPVVPRVDRSSWSRLFGKKKEILPAYFPFLGGKNASTSIDSYDNQKKFVSSIVEPIEKKARAGFQKEATRAKRMSVTNTPNTPNQQQQQQQRLGDISNGPPTPSSSSSNRGLALEKENIDNSRMETEDNCQSLIQLNMADTSKLRRMSVYDLLVPVWSSTTKRRVVLYIQSMNGSNYSKLLTVAKRENADLVMYTATMRFPGDKVDRKYTCVEGTITNVDDTAFDRLVNEATFCKDVFTQRSQQVLTEVKLVCGVTVQLDLADLVIGKQVLLFHQPEVAAVGYKDLWRAVGVKNRLEVLHVMLEESLGDSVQCLDLITSWKSVTLTNERQNETLRKKRVETTKKATPVDDATTFIQTTQAKLTTFIENNLAGYRFLSASLISEVELRGLIDIAKTHIPVRFAIEQSHTSRHDTPMRRDTKAWFQICASLRAASRNQHLSAFGLIFGSAAMASKNSYGDLNMVHLGYAASTDTVNRYWNTWQNKRQDLNVNPSDILGKETDILMPQDNYNDVRRMETACDGKTSKVMKGTSRTTIKMVDPTVASSFAFPMNEGKPITLEAGTWKQIPAPPGFPPFELLEKTSSATKLKFCQELQRSKGQIQDAFYLAVLPAGTPCTANFQPDAMLTTNGLRVDSFIEYFSPLAMHARCLRKYMTSTATFDKVGYDPKSRSVCEALSTPQMRDSFLAIGQLNENTVRAWNPNIGKQSLVYIMPLSPYDETQTTGYTLLTTQNYNDTNLTHLTGKAGDYRFPALTDGYEKRLFFEVGDELTNTAGHTFDRNLERMSFDDHEQQYHANEQYRKAGESRHLLPSEFHLMSTSLITVFYLFYFLLIQVFQAALGVRNLKSDLKERFKISAKFMHVFVSGELMRRLVEQWAAEIGLQQEELVNAIDYCESFKQYRARLKEAAIKEKDEWLQAVLFFLEIGHDKFELMAHSVAIGNSIAIECSYSSMVGDWLACGQTKYPHVAARQQVVLYKDLDLMKLHKLRCNRFVCLNEGKNHNSLDGIEEHVNRLLKRMPRFSEMDKVILASVFLGFCLSAKVFLDLHYGKAAKRAAAKKKSPSLQVAENSEMATLLSENTSHDRTTSALQDPYGEHTAAPKSPYTAKNVPMMKRARELIIKGKLLEAVKNRTFKNFDLWSIIPSIETPLAPKKKKSRKSQKSSKTATASTASAEAEAPPAEQETQEDGDDDDDDDDLFPELAEDEAPDASDPRAFFNFITGNGGTADLDEVEGETSTDKPSAETTKTTKVQIDGVWITKGAPPYKLLRDYPKKRLACLKSFQATKPLDFQEKLKVRAQRNRERNNLSIEHVRSTKERATTESMLEEVALGTVESPMRRMWELEAQYPDENEEEQYEEIALEQYEENDPPRHDDEYNCDGDSE